MNDIVLILNLRTENVVGLHHNTIFETEMKAIGRTIEKPPLQTHLIELVELLFDDCPVGCHIVRHRHHPRIVVRHIEHHPFPV